MTDRKSTYPGKGIMRLTTDLVVGTGVGSFVMTLSYILLSFRFGQMSLIDNIQEIASLLFILLLIALIYFIPITLMILLAAILILRSRNAFASDGFTLVLLLGLLGIGLGVLASLLMVEMLGLDGDQELVRNGMMAAGVGGAAAGAVIGFRKGGKT